MKSWKVCIIFYVSGVLNGIRVVSACVHHILCVRYYMESELVYPANNACDSILKIDAINVQLLQISAEGN